MSNAVPDQATYLSIFQHTEPETLKRFVGELLHYVGPVDVMRKQTALKNLAQALPSDSRESLPGEVMVAEVMVAEAQVQIEGVPGQGSCTGCDRENALAIAILDALLQGGRLNAAIVPFIEAQRATQRCATHT